MSFTAEIITEFRVTIVTHIVFLTLLLPKCAGLFVKFVGVYAVGIPFMSEEFVSPLEGLKTSFASDTLIWNMVSTYRWQLYHRVTTYPAPYVPRSLSDYFGRL